VKEIFQEYLQSKESLGPPTLTPGLHKIGIRNQKNCYVCSTEKSRKTSRYYCIDCNQNVCVTLCFSIMHTKVKINRRNKISLPLAPINDNIFSNKITLYLFIYLILANLNRKHSIKRN